MKYPLFAAALFAFAVSACNGQKEEATTAPANDPAAIPAEQAPAPVDDAPAPSAPVDAAPADAAPADAAPAPADGDQPAPAVEAK